MELELELELILYRALTDAASQRIKAQYETNPYPRWVNVNPYPVPSPIAKVFEASELQIFDDKVREINAPNILVIGFRKSQHAIGTALCFQGSKVLVLALSLSSLACARHKTEELGLKNIK